MEFAVNIVLILEFIAVYITTYRLNWAAMRAGAATPEIEAVRRRTARAYYVALTCQFLCLGGVVMQLMIRQVLQTWPTMPLYVGGMSVGIAIAIVVLYVGYARFPPAMQT